MEIVKLRHVSHSFDRQQVLQDINLSIGSGGIFGLLGPSGSGKTTLVKTIVGTLTPTAGAVVVLDTRMPSLQTMGSIGYMAQADALYHELTAKENLAFFAAIYGVQKKQAAVRIDQVLEDVELQDSKHKIVHGFSGGMKRRLSLAAALIHQPELLILDEPTVGIDPLLRNKIWGRFADLKRRGTTIIVTTHVMDEAERCDTLGLLRDGNIIAHGSPDALKQETGTDSIEQAFLIYGRGKA
ncbi:ATP-binding cassette domain-containing protein [Sediminibacillus dalangtanensis]|uniref:ATP-binding cassette domain-containing protein n=1 Tax=Sediminibacillus dalangtanensis TaxID=2729421 RepID=A0ABX7VMP8_9BACI|nr:ABC transporter ATP-binding protein [Sediminibacillus dalangtanensis]QTM98061.1 ATP-binding cassette domain-containing protein [Sediminibacillus dalangtanensis]